MILAKPYAERRVLVIAPRNESEAKASTVNWEHVIMIAAPMYYLAYKGVRSLLGGSGDGGAVRTSLPSGVLGVSHDEAVSELAFPPGHPLLDHAYAGHPLAPQKYVPYAAFHRFLFEEKVNELMTRRRGDRGGDRQLELSSDPLTPVSRVRIWAALLSLERGRTAVGVAGASFPSHALDHAGLGRVAPLILHLPGRAAPLLLFPVLLAEAPPHVTAMVASRWGSVSRKEFP